MSVVLSYQIETQRTFTTMTTNVSLTGEPVARIYCRLAVASGADLTRPDSDRWAAFADLASNFGGNAVSPYQIDFEDDACLIAFVLATA